MYETGTQADLAREMGISRAAVSQAFKKHNIQLSVDGKFDLDYAAWLLREKQDAAKSKAQRAAKKQLPGLKNPRLKREVIRLLWPIRDETFKTVIRDTLDSEPTEEDLAYVEDYLAVFSLVWNTFHKICDREFPADIGDFPYQMPESIDFDFTVIPPRRQLLALIGSGAASPTPAPQDIDYAAMPLEELERLVLSAGDNLDAIEADIFDVDDELERLVFDADDNLEAIDDLVIDDDASGE
jgi:hypothetical protein